MSKKKILFLFLAIVAMAILGCSVPDLDESTQAGEGSPLSVVEDQLNEKSEDLKIAEDVVPVPPDEPLIGENQENTETPEKWQYGGLAIEGNYADSDFVEIGNGKYRMYYAIEPEVPGNQLEVYSALSSDGLTWIPENGVRRKFTVFPDVVKLPDGRWRMYFQKAGVIQSATSSDGLSWNDESGTRVDTKNNEGLIFEKVAGPTTLYDGSKYIMAYSGSISGKYKDAPNPEMAVLMWATSTNGLEFEVQGLALDTRNDDFYGFADTPDLIHWDDGSIKMFFWGYFGIYESIFTGTGFTEPKMVYEARDEDPMHRFPSSPPGDPTLGKVNGGWYMYYGQHTKGIYYATLE